MNDQAPTILVVDDDHSVLQAVSRLLGVAGFNVVTFDSAQKMLEKYDPNVPGCIVLDVSMPGLNGLELQEQLSAGGSSMPVIFLTGRGDIPMSVRAMKQGAADFLTKPVQKVQLVGAVRAAVAKDRAARLARSELATIRSKLAMLTPREYQVFEHVISGKLNKQTAFELGTAEGTVKVHRARVMEKLGVESVAELVRLAERVGIHDSAPSASSPVYH